MFFRIYKTNYYLKLKQIYVFNNKKITNKDSFLTKIVRNPEIINNYSNFYKNTRTLYMKTGKYRHLVAISKENNDQIGAIYTTKPEKFTNDEFIIRESISQNEISGAIPQIFTQESLDFLITKSLSHKNSILFQLSQIHAPWARLLIFYHLNNTKDQHISITCNYKKGLQKLEIFPKEKIQELIKKEDIDSSFNLK